MSEIISSDKTTASLAASALRDATTLSAIANASTKKEWDSFVSTLPPECEPAVEVAVQSAKGKWHAEIVASLTQTQKAAYDAVVNEGRSVFLTGSAGCGKSFLFKAMVEGLDLKGGVRYKVTATTASAAVGLELNACTLHSFARLGLGDKPLSEVMRNRRKATQIRDAWNNVDVLFVDEVSMLDVEYFEKLGEVARLVRRNRAPKRDARSGTLSSAAVGSNSFGGLQLVLSGDFFQLPPVVKQARSSGLKYAFQTELWSATVQKTFVLKEPQRQRGDPAFAKLLDRVRVGRLIEADRTFLKGRIRPPGAPLPENATRIRSHRADVQAINSAALARLPGEPTVLVARHGLIVPLAQRESWVDERLKKSIEATPTDEKLPLKVGSRVLLVANLNPGAGLVKGARGTVVRFESAVSVATTLSSTKLHKSRQGSGGKRHLEPETCPVVRFEALNAELPIPRWVWEFELPDIGDFYVEQFPLLGADAITCHRAQGMTLPCVEIGLDKIFDAGQAYVGLGRTPTAEGLFLTCFSDSAIRVDPAVDEFYRSLDSNLGG